MEYDVIFESERIKYIKINDSLVQDYLTMINDEGVQQYISHVKKTYTLEKELEWIKDKLEENAIIFSMIDKETNEFIGNVEVIRIVDNVGELGISLTPSKQNQHYGQEALKAITDYALNELHLDNVDLNVHCDNARGIACYEKSGFEKVGQGKEIEDIHMVYKR